MIRKTIFALLFLLVFVHPAFAAAEKSDSEIKKQLITESISSYSGNCPCPYNSARNGSRCGKRSAYSKPGGYSPLCYESDVTPAMVAAYKNRKAKN